MKFTTPQKNPELNEYNSANRNDEGKRHIVIVPDVKVTSLGDHVSIQLSEGGMKTLSEIDESIIASAIENKEEWFRRKTIPDSTITKCYQPLGSTDTMADMEKVPQFQVYNHEKEKVSETEDMTGHVALEIIELWFGKSTFGLNCKLVQMILSEPQEEEPEEDEPYPDTCIF